MITKAQEKKYVAMGGVKCPVCGYDNIEGDSFDVCQGNVYQKIYCPECGEEWTDEYRLTGIEEVE